MKINFILFDIFETLDVFGPVEILSRIENADLHYISMEGEAIKSRQNYYIQTEPIFSVIPDGILVIPGGQGTRNLVDNEAFISKLKSICNSAEYVLSVCTGSALLAKTGVLNNRTATSNKKTFEWVKSINRSVNWIEQARWTVDGKYYTSSGVSAGMDMSLGFISDLFGEEKAVQIARDIEYVWNRNKEYDFFNVTIDSITV